MNQTAYASMSTTGDLIRLTLRRPPLNFINLEMLEQIQHLMDAHGESPPGRMLVLDSECAAFCAGLEMTQLTREAAFLLLDRYHTVAQALLQFPRPTVAVVRGVALGAGNELAACCDFVLSSAQATFGQPEIKVGVMPSLAPLLLPHRIGTQRTLQLILTGNPVDAKEAERMGLVFRSLPESALEPAIEELLNNFRGFSSSVLQLTLRFARGPRLRELENNLKEAQSLYLNDLMDLEDPAEGVRAFLEKRPPKWSHK